MSFFGFDSSKPQRPKEQGQEVDAILEERFKYAATEDVAQVLEEEDGDLNDLTFGDAEPGKIGS